MLASNPLFVKRKKWSRRSSDNQVAENILNREFTSEKPKQKWVTDVTEFKYGCDKKTYLSSILDLYDNSIVASVVSRRNDNQLAF